MPIYQLQCIRCGNEFEIMAAISEKEFFCRKCRNGLAIKIPSVRGPNCSNDHISWGPSVLEVVDKDSKKPHVLAFRKDPTSKTLYKAWMKGEGLRPFENGEKSDKFKFDAERHAGKIMEEKIKRERYEVRG